MSHLDRFWSVISKYVCVCEAPSPVLRIPRIIMYNTAPEPERDETDPLQNHDNINYNNEPLATFNNTTAATGDVNYNYFNSSSPSTFQQASGNFASFGGGGGGAPFDNVDISRGPSKFSSGTPFETVHEYFSVSNKVQTGEKNLIFIYYNSYLSLPSYRNSKCSWIPLRHMCRSVGSFLASPCLPSFFE